MFLKPESGKKPQNSACASNDMESVHKNSNIIHNRGFSCDVISSQFCKPSYSQPPCWFPLSMAWYRKTQQNVALLFI